MVKSNMDDEIGDFYDRLPKLEDLCVKFIRANVICWRPEDFLGKVSAKSVNKTLAI